MFIMGDKEKGFKVHFSPEDMVCSTIIGGERTEKGVVGRPLILIELNADKAWELDLLLRAELKDKEDEKRCGQPLT